MARRVGFAGRLGAVAVAVALASAGCATSASPVAQLERAQEAVATARDLGAAFAPGAQDYLHSASQELSEAQRLAVRGHNERARSMAMRAQADADLAARLAHEASLRAATVDPSASVDDGERASASPGANVGGGPRDAERPEPAGASSGGEE